MEFLLAEPVWSWVVIILVTIGIALFTRLATNHSEIPDPDPAGVLARREKERKREILKQKFGDHAGINEERSDLGGFSDLTIGEVRILIKDFFWYCFVIILAYGIPYLIILGGFGLVEMVIPEEIHSIFNWGAGLVLLGIVVVLVFKDPAYTLAWFGALFTDISRSISGLSHSKQILILVLIVGEFYLAIAYPFVWFVSSIAVLIPLGFTYERYQALLKNKAQRLAISYNNSGNTTHS